MTLSSLSQMLTFLMNGEGHTIENPKSDFTISGNFSVFYCLLVADSGMRFVNGEFLGYAMRKVP